MTWFINSRQHLADSQCSYREHLTFAAKASLLLMLASIASIIHAFWPGVLKGFSAKVVIDLYNQRLKDHPNPLYQQWINEKQITDN